MTDRKGSSASRVAIVGAGIAGLSAAGALREAGHSVALFDKGRGVGGRTSLRRADPFAFDHGAQYFTARDPRFRSVVDACVDAGVVARWDGRMAVVDAPGTIAPGGGDGTDRFVGVPGMNALAKHLAREHEVTASARVTSIGGTAGAWTLALEDGREATGFDVVLVTTPPAQAAPLVAASEALWSTAESVDMGPCWAAMVGFERPFDAPFDGAFVNTGPLTWVCRNSSKAGRPAGDAWVLHASPSWTREHLDAPKGEVCGLLVRALADATGLATPPLLHADAHRWMFSGALPPREDGAAFDAELGLGLAGDWLNGSKVQGAWLSGLTLAERVLAR